MAEIVQFIDAVLFPFHTLFTDTEFRIFLFVVLGFMTRRDGYGFSSFLRGLGLKAGTYDSIERFFKRPGFTLDSIRQKWYQALKSHAPLFSLCERRVLLGDGTIQGHFGRFMPLVRKLASSNGTAEEVEYVNGQYWGVVTVLAEACGKIMSIPAFASIQQGFQEMLSWTDRNNPDHLRMEAELSDRARSHVVEMIHCAVRVAQTLGPSLIVLDRYFLTVPVLAELKLLNDAHSTKGNPLLHIVTRCKNTAVAYQYPPVRPEHQRGRPRKKGDRVKLNDLFRDLSSFTTVAMNIYGRKQKVRYLTLDLLWGKGLYMPLRFVLTVTGRKTAIFVSTDTEMSAEDIITAYCLRFKIETGFRTFKQVFSGFVGRFWTKSWPRYNEFKSKDEPSAVSTVSSTRDHEKILNTIFAYECYTTLGCIAMGIIQMIALKFHKHFTGVRFLRTSHSVVPSEDTVQDHLSRTLPRILYFNGRYSISRKIKKYQDGSLCMFCHQ